MILNSSWSPYNDILSTSIAGLPAGEIETVRFRLFCRAGSADIRMEFPTSDRVEEIDDVLDDRCGDYTILRNGYRLLMPDENVGELISEGDMVEVIPDPETYFTMPAMTRL